MISNHLSVYGASHTVIQLHIQFGKNIGVKGAVSASATFQVTNFWEAFSLGAHRTVSTGNRLHVAVALWGIAIVPSLLYYLEIRTPKSN